MPGVKKADATGRNSFLIHFASACGGGANGLDLAAFCGAFGTTLGGPNYLDYWHQNGDGAVNGLDLAAFRTRFGTTLP
jgi:hypothetical protein